MNGIASGKPARLFNRALIRCNKTPVLNGLSKKYAVIDYLDKSDVATIVTEFKTNALIQ